MTPRDLAIETMTTREGWPAPARALASDLGGLTRGGITATAWGLYAKLGRAATADELNALTQDQAVDFYVQTYLKAPGYALMPDPRVQALLFDFAVNSGAGNATRALQRVLGLKEDGALGPATVAAALRQDATALFVRLLCARDEFLHALALEDPAVQQFVKDHPSSQLLNLRGWNRRLEGILTEAFAPMEIIKT